MPAPFYLFHAITQSLPVTVCHGVFEGDKGHNRGHNFPRLFRLPASPNDPVCLLCPRTSNRFKGKIGVMGKIMGAIK